MQVFAPSAVTASCEGAQHHSSLIPAHRRPKALFVLDHASREVIYSPDDRCEIEKLGDFYAPPLSPEEVSENPSILEPVEVIFSGWGSPIMDKSFLDAASNLKAVFYGAGSIRRLATEAFWDRGISITSAYGANAVPVAEYTLSVIILSLKRFWSFSAMTRRGEGWGDHLRPMPGAFRTTVGIVSCGMIARKLIDMLKMFDLRCLVYCPFLSAEEADELGVERCSLEDVFRRSDVVSLHTPLLPETVGLITGRLVSMMKPETTLINTSRGPIIRETEMLEVLRNRPDITAVLDVCDPEPPVPGSDITTLPNVILTPHIAGSHGPECFRLGKYMLDEFRRYLAGEPLKWQISKALAAKLA